MCVWGGGEGWEESVSIKRVQDLPERNTAEVEGAVEAPEGKRSRNYVAEEGEKRRGERSQRIRGPLSPALRPSQRGGRGREAWLYFQPGDTRSLSARSGPEPEQGKPAYRRREIQRGADRESMRGAGHVAQRDTHTETAAISAHTGMHPHSSIDRGNQRSRAEGFIRNTYINKYLHNRDIFERKYHKLQQSEESYEASSTWICAHQRWALLGRSEVLTYYYIHRTAKKME